MLKVAYICEPYLGGLYTFFLEMRPAFRKVGVDFICLAPHPCHRYRQGRNIHDDGVTMIPFDRDDDAVFTGKLSQFLSEEKFTGVIVVPGNSQASTLLPCILDPKIVSIALVPHNGRGVYLPTSRIHCHLDWIVAVNSRLRDDLIARYGLAPTQVERIFIGIDTTRYYNSPRTTPRGSLTLAFTSRLEDLQKNIFILPAILEIAKHLGGHYRLLILCGGPDEQALRTKFVERKLIDNVVFEPNLPRESMLDKLASADVFLMTSRFEGCPHALIEAMALGCVPVVSRLNGIFDTMVRDGAEGYLCKLDDPADFARRLHELAHDPSMKKQMAAAARARASQNFDVEQAATAYGKLLMRTNTKKCLEPLAVEDAFRRYGKLVGRNWRVFVPAFIKKMVWTYMAKTGKSL